MVVVMVEVVVVTVVVVTMMVLVVKLMVTDVSRAYFHAMVIRPVYVKFAAEDCLEGEEDMCRRLNLSMWCP